MGTKLQKTVDYGNYQVVTDYLAGYQYETKPVNRGGRGYAQLLLKKKEKKKTNLI